MSQPEILSYASPTIAKPPSRWLYLLSFWGSVVAGAIGVLILVLYAVTALEGLAIGGFYWLLFGGGITFVAFVLGCIYALMAKTRRFPAPSTPGKAWRVVLLPIVNCALAAGCFFGGLWLMGYHARVVIIRNKGTTPIDAIDLKSPSFQWSGKTLKPGESVSVHFPERHDETMTMMVHINSKRIPYTVMESMGVDPVNGGPRYVHLDGETGYKNRQRWEPD